MRDEYKNGCTKTRGAIQKNDNRADMVRSSHMSKQIVYFDGDNAAAVSVITDRRRIQLPFSSFII